MTTQFETPFEGSAAAVADARHFVRDVLVDVVGGLPDALVDDAQICASELVTNAVTHTDSGQPGGKLTVRLEVADRHVHIEVIDQGSATDPTINGTSGEDGLHGRGLLICAALGTYGSCQDGGGCRVWVDLPRPAARAARLDGGER